jgi:sulfite reductase alpha subunit-like flavoprotein
MAQVAIYFGSQSGTAECFASEIHEEAASHGISSEVFDLRTFTPDSFSAKPITILVVATYGDGEPTDNAQDFGTWMRNPNLGDIPLKGQRFAVMGLGDMNYTKFNQFGSDTDFNLERLGSKRFYERGVGDDSQDIAEDFKKWKEGGFWDALKKVVAEVEIEGGFVQMAKAVVEQEASALPFYLYVGNDENDGAAKDIADCLTEKMQSLGLECAKRQCLSDRKACEVVKKMPKYGVALVVVDAGPSGMCAAGKKLVRNMNVELDKEGLKEKGVMFSVLTVATSKCNNSATMLKNQIQQNCITVGKAFDRLGAVALNGKVPTYVDAGVDDPKAVIDELGESLSKILAAPPPKKVSNQAQKAEKLSSEKPDTKNTAATAARTVVLCTGSESREGGQAMADAFGSKCSLEDAALVSLAGAAREQTRAVLVVECDERGLTDGSRGFYAQLNSAPASMQAQLRKLKFALVTVVVTDVGNAGERANANAARAEIARAVEPLSERLVKMGAICVSTSCVDLQDADEKTMADICVAINQGFSPTPPGTKPEKSEISSDKPVSLAAPVNSASGLPEVRLSPTLAGLAAEAEGAPADVLARFYFEADKAKILKVRELRQDPLASEGLSTVEVEIEALNNLKDYSLGGTLSLLPESDPEDLTAVLPLLGLKSEDLSKYLTFVVGHGEKLKQPFPTPCTLREALSCYCDLARAPSKKMLVALQAKIKEPEAKECLSALLKDDDAMKMFQSSSLCCRMHEFWAMIGVKSLDLGDFLLNCPRQKAREFTIASSPKATPGKITLCVSLSSNVQPDLGSVAEMLQKKGAAVQNVELTRGRFYGVCSNWLTSRLKAGDIVLAKQRASPLKLPEKDVPIIMIAAGAGIAPFRGFVEDLRKSSRNAPAMLFFGCRHPDKDWLYKQEMNAAVKLRTGAMTRLQVGVKRPLAALFPAFSRPDEESSKKYVQDAIREQTSTVKQALESDASVFICGSTAMGNAVLEALADCCDNGKGMVENLRKEGRIIAEMWG